MVRLLLRLPDERGTLPDIGVWPKQKDVAVALQLSAGRIPQLLRAQRVRWRKLPAVRALREEILELLAGLGRIASAAEIADALAVRRGTRLTGREQRRALALAAVRAVVEVEQFEPETSEFRHTANREATDEARVRDCSPWRSARTMALTSLPHPASSTMPSGWAGSPTGSQSSTPCRLRRPC